MENKPPCCSPENINKKGATRGILFGLIPHTFCLLFIIFSIAGATGMMAISRKFLLIPHIFLFLVIVSLLSATLSAVIYLKKIGRLSFQGIISKWKYVSLLYSATIATNIVIIFVLFPLVANMQSGERQIKVGGQAEMSISVDIPCSGHAPLIIQEIKKDAGVSAVKFKMPDTFEISYDIGKTSSEKICGLPIFKTFKLTKTLNEINANKL